MTDFEIPEIPPPKILYKKKETRKKKYPDIPLSRTIEIPLSYTIHDHDPYHKKCRPPTDLLTHCFRILPFLPWPEAPLTSTINPSYIISIASTTGSHQKPQFTTFCSFTAASSSSRSVSFRAAFSESHLSSAPGSWGPFQPLVLAPFS